MVSFKHNRFYRFKTLEVKIEINFEKIITFLFLQD